MEALKDTPGTVKLPQLNREQLIKLARKRAKQGGGPTALAIGLLWRGRENGHAFRTIWVPVSPQSAGIA
jgi:hypothetical protein